MATGTQQPRSRPAPRRTRPPVGPRRAGIAGLGAALPTTSVPNAPIAARLGVEPEWIVSRTGVHRRRVARPTDRLSDLAAAAGAAALADAGIAPEAVDLVLVATLTADELTPAAAPLVAHEVGATGAGAMDVGAACTGFLSGLALAAAAVESGRARAVLVVGADLLSRLTDFDDRRTAALFGDGAGAVVIARSVGRAGIGPVLLWSDGSGAASLRATRAQGVIEMDGPEVFRHAVTRMTAATRDACAAAGSSLADVDLFVYHQANARILQAIAQRLGLPPRRLVDCIDRYGNTSAASIPLALEAARADGRLHDGARVLLSAFGAGYCWGAGIVEWGIG